MNEHAPTLESPPATAATIEPWPHGHRLGLFELRGVITRSNTAVVYRGWDHELARPIAIKEYLPQRLVRRSATGSLLPIDEALGSVFEQSLEAFLEEARTLAHCDHPALVRVLHLVQAYGTAYRVMPLYTGSPLSDVRREMNSAPNEEALRALIDELLGALEAYHRVGGVHGGVSPQQVLMLEDEHALLLGPGSARTSSWRPQGPWVDLRGVAETVRSCMSGAPPGVYSESLQNTLAATTSANVDERPQTVAQFRALLGGASAASAARPPSHGVDAEIASLIGRVIDSIPAPSRPPSPPSPAVPPPKATVRHRVAEPSLTDELTFRAEPSLRAEPPRAESVRIDPLRADPLRADPLRADPFRAEASPAGPRPRSASRKRRVIGTAATVLVFGVAAYAAWQSWVDNLRADRLATLAANPVASTTVPPERMAINNVAPAAEPGPNTAPAAPAVQVAPQAPAPAPALVPAPAAIVAPPAISVAPLATTPRAAAAEAPPPIAGPADAEAGRTAKAAPRPRPPIPSTPSPRPKATVAGTGSAVAAGSTGNSAGASSPRALCGERTEFSLYRCMQQQCARAVWQHHPQCVRLRVIDSAQ